MNLHFVSNGLIIGIVDAAFSHYESKSPTLMNVMSSSNTTFSDPEQQTPQSNPTPATYSPVEFQKELIQHLSLEIDTHKKMIFDWRARAAFYWLVGPFVAIGSVVVITKQVPQFSSLHGWGLVAAITACGSFVVMGVLGAKMEAGMWDQINIWRETIRRLTKPASDVLTENDVIETQRVMTGYVCAHLLLLLALLTTLFLLSQSPVINASSSPATATPAQATAPNSVTR